MHIDQIWTKKSGNTIATLEENSIVAVDLPISEPTATITLISGSLPKGTRIVGHQIIGTPAEVAYETKYRFVLRASYNSNLYDRTFNIIVNGSDVPQWTTAEDLLPIGNNKAYFVLDNALVDFQLEATDEDTRAGQTLRYSLASGTLPPGLSLTVDGKIQGIVDPILAIEKAQQGGYDIGAYDYGSGTGYDWYSLIAQSSNGFDSYYYDLVKYDISVPTKVPRKLNRYFEFTVDLTDGEFVIPRTFRIFVVGDDFFTSDVTLMQAGTGTFTADVSKLRAPVWLTPSDFGYRRANNYVSLPLQVINNATLEGLVWYRLEEINDDGTDSLLPPGLGLDFRNGYIVGRTPFQPSVTKTYKFTVTATRVSFDSERVELQQYAYEDVAKNAATIKISKTEKITELDLIGRTFTVLGFTYKILNADFSNSLYDEITLTFGTKTAIPKGTEINLGIFDLTEAEEAKSTKTFTVKLLGEVESEITWVTDADLGSISANYVSVKKVVATSSVTNANVFYTLTSGSLPPGMRLNFDGELLGTVKSFGNVNEQGLTVFDSSSTKFDNNTTRLDREFNFTVTAKDHFGYSLNTRTFKIKVADPNDKEFSNLFIKPSLIRSKRDKFRNIINDPQIFKPEWLFRPSDANFGIQDDPKVLLYSGIETKNMQHYIAATNLYGKRKTYQIGQLKTAVAKELGTQNIVYEVVYLDVIDPSNSTTKSKTRKTYLHNDNTPLVVNSAHYDNEDELYDSEPYHVVIGTREQGDIIFDFRLNLTVETRENEILEWILANKLYVGSNLGNNLEVEISKVGAATHYKIRPTNPNVVTADFDLYTVDSIIKNKKTIASIDNLRDEIKKIGETEKDFLPLWMQTPQDSIAEIGYVPALVLCYCKPGTSSKVIEKINSSSTNFKEFELDADRLIIDNAENNANDQYIVFQDKEYVV